MSLLDLALALLGVITLLYVAALVELVLEAWERLRGR